jgi:hypothetical protein
MSYTIAVSPAQLLVIKTALQTCPIIPNVDGMGDPIQPALIELIDMTLSCPENDGCLHGFVL